MVVTTDHAVAPEGEVRDLATRPTRAARSSSAPFVDTTEITSGGAVAVEGGAGHGHRVADADPGKYPASTSELASSEVNELPAGVYHLMTADQVVDPGWVGTCITLCGEDVCVGTAGATPVDHCPGCKCVPRFCPQCVREASQWSAEA